MAELRKKYKYFSLEDQLSKVYLMRNTDLKLSLPSEMSAAFCAILDEYSIKHSVEKKVSNGPSLVVNSAQDSIKEIVIEIINSGPFWTAFSACFIAYINRSSKKKATVKNGDKEMSLENANHHELMVFLEDAKSIVFRDGDNKSPPDAR